jgi:AraC-like DNA-binding protein
MKQSIHLIVLLAVAILIFAGCNESRPVKKIANLGDTPYQEDSILVVCATNPERAFILLDSAVKLGNIDEYKEKYIRASIYSKSLTEQNLDSALIICKELLQHDSVKNNPGNKESILNLLIATSRYSYNKEDYLYWSIQKADLCREQKEEVELLRTEAEIGFVMTTLGQIDEGIVKLDESIRQLDKPGSIDRMDAFIVAVKRKINVLNEQNRPAEVIPLAQRILARLDHYEQHASDYAEDSYRLSWSDNPSDRERYIDFSRAQAYGFLAIAYASSDTQKAREYLTLFDQSNYGKTFSARKMIIPAQMLLGMYNEAMATSNEWIRRMGADTLNEHYAILLRDQATAAKAKGHTIEALNLMERYAQLSKTLSDSLQASEAHENAARYHAKEQELIIQQAESANEIKNIVIGVIVLLMIIAAIISFYYRHQRKIISEKNRVLVRIVNGMQPELPDEEPEDTDDSDESKEVSEIVPSDSAELFATIEKAICNEHLYSNLNLQRQDICNRFGISRHTLNDLLNQFANGQSFTRYINTIRLSEAVKLLHDHPSMTITAIAKAVGFTPANLREQFKQKYGMTPQEYRQNI